MKGVARVSCPEKLDRLKMVGFGMQKLASVIHMTIAAEAAAFVIWLASKISLRVALSAGRYRSG